MLSNRTPFQLVILFLCLSTITVWAQKNHLIDSKSTLAKKHEIYESEEGWLYFTKKPHIKEIANDMLQEKKSFSLNSDDVLKTKNEIELSSYVNKNTKWSTGGVLKVNQLHKGYRVEATQLSIHYDERGNVKLMHGKLAKNLPSDYPKIKEEDALKIALTSVNAEKYAWEDEGWEQQIKDDLQNQKASFFPKGELMYARVKPVDDFSAANFRLVYRFEIKSLAPSNQQQEVMIDAQSGEVIRKQSTAYDAWGTVNTMYNGARGFTTQWRGFPNYDYVLKDKSSGDKLHTLKWSATTAWSLRREIDDKDNVWSEPAATTHWAIQMAWEYYWTTFTRNGMNNSGGKIRIEAESSEVGVAQYYRTGGYDYLKFGRSATTAVNGNLASLDISGHEFTHGVTANEAGLIYQGESGALNESFSDIFGVMVERHIEGGVSWTMGEDAGFTIRSLENPNLFNHPDTFQGINWIDPASGFDNGGVHINSGVQNFWFFLLSTGGAGINDLGQNFNVQGIGIVNAARIAYRNLSIYLQPGSTYADARAGAINSARDLFGDCSIQHMATINAWQAVGIGAAIGLCASDISPSYTQFCIEDGNFSTSFFLNVSPATATVTWDAPNNWNFSANGGSFSLNNIVNPQPGNYTLTATITSGNEIVWRTASLELTECNNCPGGPPCQYELRVAPTIAESEKSKSEVKLVVYPIPASNKLNVNLMMPKKEESLLSIVDIMGKSIIKATFVSEGFFQLDVEALKPGVYFVIVTNDSGRWIEKIIIEH